MRISHVILALATMPLLQACMGFPQGGGPVSERIEASAIGTGDATATGPDASGSVAQGQTVAHAGTAPSGVIPVPAAPSSEADALVRIKGMSQQECQEGFQLLTDFYAQTEGMAEQDREAYFQTLVRLAQARGLPAPAPPPAPGSPVYAALESCATGEGAAAQP